MLVLSEVAKAVTGKNNFNFQSDVRVYGLTRITDTTDM